MARMEQMNDSHLLTVDRANLALIILNLDSVVNAEILIKLAWEPLDISQFSNGMSGSGCIRNLENMLEDEF